MESIKMDSATDTNESETEQSNIDEKNDNSVTDITTLDIKSRLSLKTTEVYGEPHTNGIPRQGHLNQHDEAETLSLENKADNIQYVSYTSELQMPDIMHLIQKDLSEPYSIYTYRYFIHNWPKLCFLKRRRWRWKASWKSKNFKPAFIGSLCPAGVEFTENCCFLFVKAMHGDECVGAIVCKLDIHKKDIKRGYIAMLAVDVKYRKRKVGSNLVRRAIQEMSRDNADEVVLETEITNRPALRLYENLGFVRDKRLFRYYLNGVDAFRLKLWLK